MQLDAVIFVKKHPKCIFIWASNTCITRVCSFSFDLVEGISSAEQWSPCRSLQTVLDVFTEMEKKGLLSNTKLDKLHSALKEVDQRLAETVHDFMQPLRGIGKHALTVIIIIHSSLCLNGNSQANVLFSVVPRGPGTPPPAVMSMVSRFTCVSVTYIIVCPAGGSRLVYFFPTTFSQFQFVWLYPRPSPEVTAGIFSWRISTMVLLVLHMWMAVVLSLQTRNRMFPLMLNPSFRPHRRLMM